MLLDLIELMYLLVVISNISFLFFVTMIDLNVGTISIKNKLNLLEGLKMSLISRQHVFSYHQKKLEQLMPIDIRDDISFTPHTRWEREIDKIFFVFFFSMSLLKYRRTSID